MSAKRRIPFAALRIAALCLIGGSLTGMVSPAAACTENDYAGTVCTVAYEWCPRGYVPADGGLLEVGQYPVLHALIGFKYGGGRNGTSEDGQHRLARFALPDLRGRAVIGIGTATAYTPAVQFAQRLGHASITLAADQVPLRPHSHPASFSDVTASGEATLPVSGKVRIATTENPIAKLFIPSENSVLTQSALPNANIYAPAGTTNNLTIGPDDAVTGSASGPVSLSVSGGTVTIDQTGDEARKPVSLYQPSLGMTVCINVSGMYTPRP